MNDKKIVPLRKEPTMPMLKASGKIRIIDKDGKLKGEMEITSVQLKGEKEDGIT